MCPSVQARTKSRCGPRRAGVLEAEAGGEADHAVTQNWPGARVPDCSCILSFSACGSMMLARRSWARSHAWVVARKSVGDVCTRNAFCCRDGEELVVGVDIDEKLVQKIYRIERKVSRERYGETVARS